MRKQLLKGLLSFVLLILVAGWSHAQQCSDFAQNRCRIELEPHHAFVKETKDPITRVSIAQPEIADIKLITPTQVLVVAQKNLGSTNLILWHGDERAEVYDVRVFMPDDLLRTIEEHIQLLVPDARVSLVSGPNGLMITGEVESQESLDRVLKTVQNHVDSITNLVVVRGTQQVQLEVKVAEVSRSGIKKMGLGFLTNSDWTIGLFPSGNAQGQVNVSSPNQQNLGLNTEIGSPFATAFQIVLASLDDNFLSILSLLKGQNLARMLASPTLVTMNGQEASFLVGGEFPYPMEGDLGQATIQFKSYGIRLNFTPYVVGRETITLKVEPEVSNIDFAVTVFSGGTSVPGLKTRRGSATLQLKDGQTFVMAGLLKEETATVVNKVPFLGDLPLIGTLFTSKEFQKEETELMVIVTPRLVKALNPDGIPDLPGHNLHDDVSDLDFFLLNRALPREKTKSEAEETGSEKVKFIGGYGFKR